MKKVLGQAANHVWQPSFPEAVATLQTNLETDDTVQASSETYGSVNAVFTPCLRHVVERRGK